MPKPRSIWSRLRSLLGGEKAAPPRPQETQKPAAPVPPKAEPILEQSSTQPAAPQPQVALPQKKLPQQQRIASLPAVDLIIGLDLGTSCSKVVIGDPYWQDKTYAVSFAPQGDDIAAWLYRTRFGSEPNLKMRLMNEPQSEKVRALSACYLAQVIAHARSWFEANSPAEYRRRELRWSLNLGFPGKSVTSSTLTMAYEEIARVAVALASSPEPPSFERATELRNDGENVEPFIPRSRIQLYPEIAAQLAGYVKSPYYKRGNLLLIDVGAGTLDVSTIILHEWDQQDTVSFHFCDVKDLGALRLYERRAAALELVENGCVQHPLDYYQDGSRPAPEQLREFVHRPSPRLQSAFDRVSKQFAEDIVNVALSCLARFRHSQRRKHSNAAYEPWGRNLRFFMTGGGGRARFYKTHLAEGPLEDNLASYFTCWHAERHQRRRRGQGLLLEQLPTPDKLKNFPVHLQSHFDRLSVAYGLAFGGENLMKITSATK